MGLVVFGAMALYLLIAILGGARADLVDGGRWLPQSRRWRHEMPRMGYAETRGHAYNNDQWRTAA